MFIKIHVKIIECEILFSLNAINSQYELKTYESIDLKIFDIEKKINGNEDQASSDDDEVEEIKSKIEDEEELNLNNVTLDNLE